MEKNSICCCYYCCLWNHSLGVVKAALHSVWEHLHVCVCVCAFSSSDCRIANSVTSHHTRLPVRPCQKYGLEPQKKKKKINKRRRQQGDVGEGRKEKARAKGVKRGERRMKRFDRLWSWLIRHIPRWWPCWRRSVWVCQHFHGATHGSVKAGWNRQQWSRPGYTVLLTVHVKMANACTLKPLLKWLQNMQMWMWIFFLFFVFNS